MPLYDIGEQAQGQSVIAHSMSTLAVSAGVWQGELHGLCIGTAIAGPVLAEALGSRCFRRHARNRGGRRARAGWLAKECSIQGYACGPDRGAVERPTIDPPDQETMTPPGVVWDQPPRLIQVVRLLEIVHVKRSGKTPPGVESFGFRS